MHDIWNPWHGCIKVSEGCENCYMYFLDAKYNKSGRDIYRVNRNFDYPLHKDKKGIYKIKSGERIRVCMTSDFFLKEADEWREAAWRIMSIRQDVQFFILTKRPERVMKCLPKTINWSMDNIFLNVSCENQKRADERIPLLKSLPFKHKGIMCAPLIGPINLESYLDDLSISQVICGGENYNGHRPCDYEWVKHLREQCVKYHVTFAFIETGANFIKDGKSYHMSKQVQSDMAYKSQLSYLGRVPDVILKDTLGTKLRKEELYQAMFKEKCKTCGTRIICNGCSNCGKC